jgi:hypothetical protein
MKAIIMLNIVLALTPRWICPGRVLDRPNPTMTSHLQGSKHGTVAPGLHFPSRLVASGKKALSPILPCHDEISGSAAASCSHLCEFDSKARVASVQKCISAELHQAANRSLNTATLLLLITVTYGCTAVVKLVFGPLKLSQQLFSIIPTLLGCEPDFTDIV